MKTFIDNSRENTMAEALNEQLANHRTYGQPVPFLCIATAYFNPPGFLMLADEVSHVPKVQLLLGAEPKPEAMRPVRIPGDPHEPEFSRRQVQQALDQMSKGLARDRDLLNFTPQASKSIQETIRLLKSPNIEIRRYEKSFLHAKAYLFRDVPVTGLIAGSSNLTRAGLKFNKELNLGVHGTDHALRAKDWFDELWNNAEPYDLASIYAVIDRLYPPLYIYLKVLDLLYGAELEEEKQQTGNIPLTQFQSHGVWRACRILDTYHGVIIADEVGLGKTFTAGDIINRYRERRQRVLLICPASLRNTTWKEFLTRFELFAECVSYEQLANDRQLGGEHKHLNCEIDEYALIIVDEAHNYRNPDTPTRARVLRALLHGKPKDLVLLSATPVNNSLWDLYHLVRYFLKQDAQLANRGILSLRETFSRAMREDPFDLSPDVLFPIVDAVTVKRTRAFVRKHYENDTIKGPDGNQIKIVFPKPKALSIHYNLEEALPGIFTKIERALAPKDNASPALKLARYQTALYRKDYDPEEDGKNTIIGLLRTGLLKRFESSACAFVHTTRKMVAEHDNFLRAMKEHKKVPTTEFLRELAGVEDENEFESLFANSLLDDMNLYHAEKLAKDVENDRNILADLADSAEKAAVGHDDPKLDAICNALAEMSKEAQKEGLDDEDARQKRKVLIFSYFEDTVDYLEEKISEAVSRNPDLAPYRGRIATASGTEYRSGISRTEAVEGFAPESTRATNKEDLYDILITTDVLAEGQNLQQARHIINYDLPWNPMRLVQRHGRIDRIGSKHPAIFMRTIFPDDRLNDLLDLEERVRKKLAHAAASMGLGHSPIEDGASSDHCFAETRDEIEALYNENPEIYERGGTASAAQTGEEYRQILRQAKVHMAELIDRLPWKAGTVIVRQKNPGWFFCAKVGDRVYLRFVHSDETGNPTDKIESELGFCLRQIETSDDTIPTIQNLPLDPVYQAWEKARSSILTAWDFESDPINLQPPVRPLNKTVADVLRNSPNHTLDSAKLTRALDILESPWPRREETMLRTQFTPSTKPADLVEFILEIGIEPFTSPEPLPPIDPEDIHLVVWAAVINTQET